ncbi:MAG TPA: sulfatase-like hydrolase/transferase [Labilithrix sp.]
MPPWLGRIKRVFVGERPLAFLPLAAPTALAVLIDLVSRPREMASFALQGKAIYGSSLLVSSALWFLPAWICARLWTAKRPAAYAMLALWTFPLLLFGIAGQVLYFRVFHLYMGRDTVRLGIALRGTTLGWLASWGPPTGLVLMLLVALLGTVALGHLARRAAPLTGKWPPVLAVGTFLGTFVTAWVDGIDSRYLQAATPDVCFFHGAVHAVQIAITGKGDIRQGLTNRTPAELPPIRPAQKRPNVVVVLLESVRADALCSLPPPTCRGQFLDDVAADRVPLGRLTTQTPSTFAAFMTLTTGQPPNVDLHAAHSAPVLWEIAHAAGYRTAYVTSQNPHYENFGLFTERAGIDVRLTADDLGGMAQEQIGAPDERATETALRVIRESAAPWFVVVHLSNTHAPYRIDPALRPFTPDSDDPVGDVDLFHNRYKNSVRMLERTIASFLRELRAMPAWESTVAIVLSDHGEQFREQGQLYHNHSLADVELSVPGFLVAGGAALDDDQRAALAAYLGTRTYMQDVHLTIADLFGVDRGALPYPNAVARSLVRPKPPQEPFVIISTTTAVWEPDEPYFGAFLGDAKVVGTEQGGWHCEHIGHMVLGASRCPGLIERVKAAFPARLGPR